MAAIRADDRDVDVNRVVEGVHMEKRNGYKEVDRAVGEIIRCESA